MKGVWEGGVEFEGCFVFGGGARAYIYTPSEKRARNFHSNCTDIEIFQHYNIAQVREFARAHANIAYRMCSKNSNTEKFRWLY